LVVQQIKKLNFPVTADGKILFYANDDELYEILKTTHESIGHGGRDRMISELSRKYKNITWCDVEVFLQLCEPCQQKQKGVEMKSK